MPADCLVTLTVKQVPATGGETFLYHVDVDSQPIINNQTLAVEHAKEMRGLAEAYGELFEQRIRPQLTDEILNTLGARLFDLWLGNSWAKIQAKFTPGRRRWLVIASEAAEVLNLPWELLRPAGDGAVGGDAKWTVRRLPWDDKPLPVFSAGLRPPPLRVLFMACAPTDAPELDYDREEEFLLDTITRIGPRAVYDSGDLGTFEELQQKINEFEPHIVHLSGHGAVLEGVGKFAFESEDGTSDLRSSDEIGQLFAGSNVQCAFVSGCQTGKAPDRAALGGVCQGLVREGVPMAIGWGASIADDVANELARVFYRTAATGQPIDRALTQGRQAARKLCEKRGDPSWTLPVLYAGSQQAGLFDPKRKADKPPRPSLRLQPLPGMTAGYAEHFIGRRREQQRLLPALRDGSLQAIVLTGLGGTGKSTLATRLTRKLEADGFTPIGVSATYETPLDVARLLETCRIAFLKAGLEEAYEVLQKADISIGDRLEYLVATLNDYRFVLVLDNFEVNLDEQTRKIRDPELADFYQHLIQALSGDSRVLITSRYLPADADPLPAVGWKEEQVGDFPEAAFLKYMLRDGTVEQRYYQGQLPGDLIRRLHRLLGGTPRFMEQIRKVLQTIQEKDLARELDAVEQGLPHDAGESRLQEARDRYCEDIFTGRLYGALPEDSQKWLSRAAVFAVPVPLEGLAAAAGAPVEALKGAVQAWQRSALVYPEVTRADLWSIYGTLRGWLTAPNRLSVEERRVAQEAAGDYLVKMEGQDREGELGLSWIDCFFEARALYLAADATTKAREVTGWISGFLRRRGLYRELEWINQETLEREAHPEPMLDLGRSFLDRADYASARSWFERALEIAKERTADRASALHELATIDLREGKYPAARETFGKSIEIKQQLGDRASEAATWNQLAAIDFREGNYQAARERFGKALSMLQQFGNTTGEAATWHNLATIDLGEGNYPAAREKFGKALSMRQEIGDRAGEAGTWHQLATTDAEEGDYLAAREKFGKALAIVQEIGDQAGEGGTLHALATIDLRERNYPAAQEKFGKALSILQQIGDRAGEAGTWHQLASIDLDEGNYPAARGKFDKALSIRQQIGDRAGEAATWYQLGWIGWEQERRAQGIRLIALGFGIIQSIGHADAQKAGRSLAGMADQLGYGQEQVQAMLQNVIASYQADGGRALYREAFGDELSAG